MRRYDDVVEVRMGLVDGVEAPAQLVWRDRLWQVRAIVGRWVETTPWWQRPAVQGLLGTHDGGAGTGQDAAAGTGTRRGPVSVAALVAEREVWRVDASRGRLGSRGVLQLVRDGETGGWRLTGCED